MNPFPTHTNSNVLNSWKEIAAYLERGVRTVQRWEQELQLPIHRIGVGNRSPVFAFEHEIRFWLHSTNPGNGGQAPGAPTGARAARALVLSRSIELAHRLLSAAQENRRLMTQLAQGLERMQRTRTQVRKSEATRAKVRAVAEASLLARAAQRKGTVPVVVLPAPDVPAPDERYATAAN